MFGLSASTIVSLILTILKLANSIFQRVRDDALIQAGENKEKLKQVVALDRLSSSLKEVDERFDKMTDDEVLEEITKQGDWRD